RDGDGRIPAALRAIQPRLPPPSRARRRIRRRVEPQFCGRPARLSGGGLMNPEWCNKRCNQWCEPRCEGGCGEAPFTPLRGISGCKQASLTPFLTPLITPYLTPSQNAKVNICKHLPHRVCARELNACVRACV